MYSQALRRHIQGTDRRRPARSSACLGRTRLCAPSAEAARSKSPAFIARSTRPRATSSRRTSPSIRCRAPSPATKSTACRSTPSPCTCRPWRWSRGIGHRPEPSELAGITSGSGISGSTAWHGAFRFRQYLKGVKAATASSPKTICANSNSKKPIWPARREHRPALSARPLPARNGSVRSR